MTDFLVIAAVIVIASNPLMLASQLRERLPLDLLMRASAVALLILLVLAGAATPITGALNIEPETFRIAAGVVLMVSGAAAVFPLLSPKVIEVTSRSQFVPAIVPIAWPGIANAAACMATANFGANDGGLVTSAAALAAIVVIAVVAHLLAGAFRLAVLSGARFLGGILIVTGVDMVISGVQAV